MPIPSLSHQLGSLLLAIVFTSSVLGQVSKPKPQAKPKVAEQERGILDRLSYPVAEFVEPDFPFFSSVLDLREAGVGSQPDPQNLVPRGLILNLGDGLWACYDVDLLRIAAVWQADADGPPIAMTSLATGSYKNPGQKTRDGQNNLPKPLGKLIAVSPAIAGWQLGQDWSTNDSREPGPDPTEIGRGPLAKQGSLLRSIEPAAKGVVLTLDLAGRKLRQWFYAQDGRLVCELWVGAGNQSWMSRLPRLHDQTTWQKSGAPTAINLDGQTLSIGPSDQATSVTISYGQQPGPAATLTELSSPQPRRWVESSITAGKLGTTSAAYVLDDIALPTINPWQRNVRFADIAFLDAEGHAAAVTMDGDVWLLSGLSGDLTEIKWQRYTSGFHEPMSIVARGRELLVYDRNGIWRIVDDNNDGQADRHEMFCNLFTQTCETREFPSSMKLGPKGELYIAKGGQQGTRLGRHNGSVLRIAADGQSIEVIAHGLRQPFIGVNEITGLVTASDQQGHYVPSTPLHIIQGNQFYGHLATVQAKEQYPGPIAQPLTWIPHPVNPSAVTQVWLNTTQFGPLNGALLHIGYNRPELFQVLFDTTHGQTQAAVCKVLIEGIEFSPLNGHINPADGQLYLIGFQIWGTTASRVSGLARVRYTQQPSLQPEQIIATKSGVLLRFSTDIDAQTVADLSNYSIERWNYKRSFDYGSAHYKLDGSTGQEIINASSAYLSNDRRSVFIGIPNMAICDQMHIGWSLKTTSGAAMDHNAYFTPWQLSSFDSVHRGFGRIAIDLTPRTIAVKTVVASVAEGQRLYQFIGCMGCHSIDGGVAGRLGPSWKGLYHSRRELDNGQTVVADDAYLRESIIDPSKKKVKAYLKLESGMPIYAGILTDTQIESLILYIKTLK
jgi:mono/diheme cytochrome c family protein